VAYKNRLIKKVDYVSSF